MGITAITDFFQKTIRLAPFLQVSRCLDLRRCGIAKTQQFSKLGVPDLVILTPEQIDRAQMDKKRMVRFAIAKQFDLELDPAQIELGLTDQSVDVRDIYAYRGGYTLTPEQVERGLTDESGLVRLRVATRPDVVGRPTVTGPRLCGYLLGLTPHWTTP